VIKVRETLAIRLGFVILALAGLIATLGLVLGVSYKAEQQIAIRLAQAEMANVSAKLEGLTDRQQATEIYSLVSLRHMASQLARGADPAGIVPGQAAGPGQCTTPERDQRIIAARFAPSNLPVELGNNVAGTPLDWTKIKLDDRPIQQIEIPIGAACNTGRAWAQVVIARFGQTSVVTGWITQPLLELGRLYWVQVSFGFGLFLSLGICAAVLLERRAQAQMRHLTSVLHQVGQGNFDVQAEQGKQGSEYRLLAQAIGAMAQQLASLHAGLNSLMDRTAHDLRTPLARALARISGVIAEQSDPNKRTELEGVEADLRDLSGRFGAMLALREASTLDPDLGDALNLAEVAELAGALYQDLDIADDKFISLDLKPAWVRAQRGLIQNAVANLIDNALRFAPKGTQVDIITDTIEGKATLIVRDAGPGVDPNLLASIFEAGVTSRASEGGYGLGLTTVREVAHKHGGQITLENGIPPIGLVATLSFPAIPTQRPA
jgi:signal transduction histidine kinase